MTPSTSRPNTVLMTEADFNDYCSLGGTPMPATPITDQHIRLPLLPPGCTDRFTFALRADLFFLRCNACGVEIAFQRSALVAAMGLDSVAHPDDDEPTLLLHAVPPYIARFTLEHGFCEQVKPLAEALETDLGKAHIASAVVTLRALEKLQDPITDTMRERFRAKIALLQANPHGRTDPLTGHEVGTHRPLHKDPTTGTPLPILTIGSVVAYLADMAISDKGPIAVAIANVLDRYEMSLLGSEPARRLRCFVSFLPRTATMVLKIWHTEDRGGEKGAPLHTAERQLDVLRESHEPIAPILEALVRELYSDVIPPKEMPVENETRAADAVGVDLTHIGGSTMAEPPELVNDGSCCVVIHCDGCGKEFEPCRASRPKPVRHVATCAYCPKVPRL